MSELQIKVLQTNTDSLLHRKKTSTRQTAECSELKCYTLKLIPVNVVNKQSEIYLCSLKVHKLKS